MEKALKESFSVFGRMTIKKFGKLKIYVEGLSKIGPDLVSNLVILSPEQIMLHDTTLIKLSDCHNTFRTIKVKEISQKTQLDAKQGLTTLLKYIFVYLGTMYNTKVCHRLNNKVYVDKTNVELTEEAILKYDVAVFCDIYDFGRVMAVDRYVREQKKSNTVIIYGCQMGFFGIFISDFGCEWKVFHSGVTFPKIGIESITSEERALVTTTKPHGLRTGDFVLISGVEGMNHLDGDARPVCVISPSSFTIEDTRSFGAYLKGGVCEKVDLPEKFSFASIEEQMTQSYDKEEKVTEPSFKSTDNNSKVNSMGIKSTTNSESFEPQLKNNSMGVLSSNTAKHSEILLGIKGAISFYQSNSRLPGLFEEADEEEAMRNVKIIAARQKIEYEEQKIRSIIKTCEYSFYPLINLLASLISFEVVKCTGKYTPVSEPFVLDWYERIGFEVKKKSENKIINILETSALEKLSKLQIAIVDDGYSSVELLNLLYSCSIAERSRVILLGLESIHESVDVDPMALKAHLKFQVANDLFKNKKNETLPCSLSFANDALLSDVWSKINILINSSTSLSDYVYSNVIWNQIDIIDASTKELSAILKICAAGKSHLRQIEEIEAEHNLLDYKECVERALEDFKLVFVHIFEDVRCFLQIGGVYMDKVKMSGVRNSLFLLVVCCIEEGGHLSPESIVKVCRGTLTAFHPSACNNLKDETCTDYLRALYFMFSFFYAHKEPKIEEINAEFSQHLAHSDVFLTHKEMYDIAFSKLAFGHTLQVPYAALSQLFRKDQTIKLIWNASQLYSKSAHLKEEVSSRLFYKHYFKRLKPCPFLSQMINALIPVVILNSANSKLSNYELNMLETKVEPFLPPPPEPSPSGKTLVPAFSNEWTVIIIEGPKKVSQIIDRFHYLDSVNVTKIRCFNVEIFDKEKKNVFLDFILENIPALAEKKLGDSLELHIEARDKNERSCSVSRVKYLILKQVSS